MPSKSPDAELPPALSQIQLELLREFVRPFAFQKSYDHTEFAGLVVRQLDHLVARVAEQDKLLLDIDQKLRQYEVIHMREHHQPVPGETAPPQTCPHGHRLDHCKFCAPVASQGNPSE